MVRIQARACNNGHIRACVDDVHLLDLRVTDVVNVCSTQYLLTHKYLFLNLRTAVMASSMTWLTFLGRDLLLLLLLEAGWCTPDIAQGSILVARLDFHDGPRDAVDASERNGETRDGVCWRLPCEPSQSSS